MIQKYNFNNSYPYDFKANLDLLYITKEISGYKHKTYETFYLNLSSFPDYNKTKFYLSIKSYNYNKILFINGNSIFCLANNYIGLYKISHNKFSLVNEIEIDLDSSDCEIIDLNCFYCLNDHKKILLLNKNNLNISKTIKINSNILGFIKFSNKIVSLFLNEENLSYQNYDILFDGTKWNLNKEKIIYNEKFTNWYQSNNFIIFSKGFYGDKKSVLLEIQTKKSEQSEKATKK